MAPKFLPSTGGLRRPRPLRQRSWEVSISLLSSSKVGSNSMRMRSSPGGLGSRPFLTSPSRNRGLLLPPALSVKAGMDLESGDLSSRTRMGAVFPALETHVEDAVRAVKAGKVIAVPTDTLYGFACDACSKEAVNRIYDIKGRKYTSPLAICVADVTEISRFASVDHLPEGLLNDLLPGPVTVVLSRGDSSVLEKSLNPGFDTIGVRVPDSTFIRAIARGLGSAVALTSANPSGHPSSVCIKEFEDLWQHCEFVYDGGLLSPGRAGSTVVDLLTPGTYKILRSGSAKQETVEILEAFNLEETRCD